MLRLAKEGLEALLAGFRKAGYRVLGPCLKDGVCTLGDLSGPLPRGWEDVQGPGSYRLQETAPTTLLGCRSGPQSARTYLHPPHEVLFRATQGPEGLRFEPTPTESPPLALVGLRACDVAAVAVQDRVLLDRDQAYTDRRRQAMIVAVTCLRAGGTCFCADMGAGPEVGPGADLVLTELDQDFLVEARTARGQEWTRALPEADLRLEQEACRRLEECRQVLRGRFPYEGVREVLLKRVEHPHYEAVARRCLACSNCTMVCPTCFCSTTVDTLDLSGQATRERRSDSCFHSEFSGMTGHVVRSGLPARYRQWLTHKFSTWHDQFGGPGCVGCGRCITWCPAGIDLRQEVEAMRDG